ncbi:MAG TPA: glycosyltransferase family 4 protein [Gammaproteobacteria bacterium]
MRILFCNYEYPPLGGGGGVVNAALARELARTHDVTVLTSQAFDLPRRSLEDGVRILRVPVWFRRREAAANLPSMAAYVVNAMRLGRDLVRAERFDIVNTHFALPTGPAGQHLARFAGLPNVLSVHGGDLYDPSKKHSPHRHAWLRACVRRLALAADAVVAQSRNTLDNLHRYYAPEVDAEIIPLGIERPPPVAPRRGDHGLDDADRVLVTVGRLVARKAVEQLIDVVAELRDPLVRLLVIGAGPAAETLAERARQRSVAAQVRFLGAVPERTKHELLALADLYVSTSQHEGFGLVFLEAMAAGLPVVCYDRGGQVDFLEDGATGFLVPLNDRPAFVARCRELLADAALRREIAARNRARVEELFIDRCAKRYEALFAAVIEGRGAAPVAARAARSRAAP